MRSFRVVAGVSLFAILMLVASCITVLVESRAELTRRADIMAANIVVLAERTVQIEIGRSDARLLNVLANLEARNGDFNSAAPGDLFGGDAARESGGEIIVSDAAGNVLASSQPGETPRYAPFLPDLLGRIGPDTRGLAIETITFGGQSPPELALVRPCPSGGRGAAAAVVALLPLSWIQGVFGYLDLGRAGAVALLDSNSVLLAREPVIANKIGTSVQARAIISRLPRGRIMVLRRHSRLDGIDRQISPAGSGGRRSSSSSASRPPISSSAGTG